MTYYQNKTVLITGAFGGFGKHFIQQLLKSGAKLILSDVADMPIAQIIRDRVRQNQVMATIPSDLSTPEGCRHLHNEIQNLNMSLDIIVHNAGIGALSEYIDLPVERMEAIMNINLMSVLRLNNLFAKEMVQKKSGHLIYISSVAGFVATPFGATYSASKFGLRAFAMALHGEIKKHGIRTSIVYPFWAKTPIMKSEIFGNPNIKYMPDFFASDPAYVVRKTLAGAAKGKLHICPGIFSKLMWQAVRLIPVIGEQRMMKEELIHE